MLKMWSIAYWKAYGITCRPYLFFISGAAGLLGMALIPHANWVELWPAFLAFFLTYGLGQALTDVDQTDTDSISSPYRPLVQGIISPSQVFWTSLIGLALCAAILAYQNIQIIPLSIVMVLGLKAYTYFKKIWWAGPFWNSWIVGGLVILGRLSQPQSSLPLLLDQGSVWLASLTLLASYATFVILGYFKDISADRATGYKTIVVTQGWKRAILGSAIYWGLSALSSLAFIVISWPAQMTLSSTLGLVITILGLSVTAMAHWQMARLKPQKEELSHPAIENTVRGFILLSLGLATFIRSELMPFSILFYFLFEIVLFFRPEKTQV